MSQQVVDQYVRWIIRHVRDEALKTVSNQFRPGDVADPNDPLYRGPYHRLLRAGVQESAIPAVLDLVIHAVDAAVETALWQEDQLRTTGHLRVALLASQADGEQPANWVELSSQHLTWQRFDEWVEELAEIRTAADLDALVRRGHDRAGGEWEDPVGEAAKPPPEDGERDTKR
jgi:hypothetical protein